MGGGDLNAKKAWHPNTLKNQERVWKAEQAAAEEKKRIAELERERLVERERAELNKLARSNLAQSSLSGDDRLHWMYEKPDKKVQQEEYLLGKAIDKSHEQPGKSEKDEIPAVSRRVVGSSMLTVSGDTQVDLARKMREDPLLLVKERERAARAALLNNPVQRARLADLLRKEQKTKKESKSKTKKNKSKDLDNMLAEKLQALSGKKGIDLALLLASDDSSSESSDEKSKKKKKKNKKKTKSKNFSEDDNDSEEKIHKTKHHSKSESKKRLKKNRDSSESDKVNAKRTKEHCRENNSSKSYGRKNCRDSTEDNTSDDNGLEELKSKSRYSAKNESKYNKYNNSNKPKRAITESDNVDTKRKKRQHSVEKESHVTKHDRHSSEDRQSSDDQQSRDGHHPKRSRNCVRENRYWDSCKLYSSEYQPKDDKYVSGEAQSKKEKYLEDKQHKYDHEHRQSGSGYNRNRKDLQDEKGKEGLGQTTSMFDKSRQNNKRSGLSEVEKAAKLAEMVAAGAEREKQRERRVAEQLAEKETEYRPHSHSHSRNAIRQLPNSLESRIHSNRHNIQRDRRFMNENFARR